MHVIAVDVVNSPLSKRRYALSMTTLGNNWFEIAEFCADNVATAAHGQREAALDAAVDLLAKKNPPIKIAKQTLRTALLSYRFVSALKKEDVAFSRLLRRFPAAAVETLARWYRRDPKKAKAAAQQYAERRHSLRSLIEAESASRSPKESLSGVAEKFRYTESVLERITNFHVSSAASFAGGPIEAVIDWKQQSSSEDLSDRGVAATGRMTVALGSANRTDRRLERRLDFRCAVVIVGPYSTPAQYHLRAHEWCLRALGLTFFHQMVVMVLPEAEAYGSYTEILNRSASGRVLLLIDNSVKGGRSKARKVA